VGGKTNIGQKQGKWETGGKLSTWLESAWGKNLPRKLFRREEHTTERRRERRSAKQKTPHNAPNKKKKKKKTSNKITHLSPSDKITER